MRFLEMAQQLAESAASGGLRVLTPEGSRPAVPEDIDPCWRPAPDAAGNLLQDPDFTLPSTAGPVHWALYHHSEEASQEHVTLPTVWRASLSIQVAIRLDGDGHPLH